MWSHVAEVEPFDTANHVAFHAPALCPLARALLMIGFFTERAYCRFLCPLGGVLALAADYISSIC